MSTRDHSTVRQFRRRRAAQALIAALFAPAAALSQKPATPRGAIERPMGTLREQAQLQQKWLAMRMERVLPPLMRRYGVDFWVVPMREYNEDPVFSSLVSPETFAARRRTIYVFIDRGAAGVDRIALGGTSQGGVYRAVRATKSVPAAAPGSRTTARTAELWGDDQWRVLRSLVDSVQPKSIGIDVSRTFAFADGLSAGELDGMREAMGPAWAAKFRPVEGLAVDLIATRLPEEQATYRRLMRVATGIIEEAFSNRVITPGVTRTEDVVWWMRQRVNDLGLGTWFHPSVEVQRRGFTDEQLGENPVIQRGDVLHCDFGVTAFRLNTDTQHMGYVLREGEREVPAGLRTALRQSNRLQDIVREALRPGRTGNEVLQASLERMRAEGIDGSVYSHPIGLNGHGAGPLIGLWDYQDGVPGRGDHKVIANSWFSIELQATTPVPEWNGQPVRSAQEEDVMVGADGVARWVVERQERWHVVR
jgi:Xaa-Pro aminopeptidase